MKIIKGDGVDLFVRPFQAKYDKVMAKLEMMYDGEVAVELCDLIRELNRIEINIVNYNIDIDDDCYFENIRIATTLNDWCIENGLDDERISIGCIFAF